MFHVKIIGELTDQAEDQSQHFDGADGPAVQLFHQAVQPLDPAEEGLHLPVQPLDLAV